MTLMTVTLMTGPFLGGGLKMIMTLNDFDPS